MRSHEKEKGGTAVRSYHVPGIYYQVLIILTINHSRVSCLLSLHYAYTVLCTSLSCDTYLQHSYHWKPQPNETQSRGYVRVVFCIVPPGTKVPLLGVPRGVEQERVENHTACI